jgi:hypothetical protein
VRARRISAEVEDLGALLREFGGERLGVPVTAHEA